MALILEVQHEKDASQYYELYSGLMMGRLKGHILLNDSKVSSLHARVDKNLEGALELVDLGSANGIVVNGKRVKSLVLSPGVMFRLGRVLFKVLPNEKDASLHPLHTTDSTSGLNALTDLTPNPEDLFKKRCKALNEALQLTAIKVKDQPRKLFPFRPPIELEIVTGRQKGTKWLLGYGPRHIGAHSIDIPLFEPKSPDICFELSPEENSVRFRTSYLQTVFLNGKSLAFEILSDGDIITIFNTTIKVHFYREIS